MGQEYWQGGHDTGGPSTLRRFHFRCFKRYRYSQIPFGKAPAFLQFVLLPFIGHVMKTSEHWCALFSYCPLSHSHPWWIETSQISSYLPHPTNFTNNIIAYFLGKFLWGLSSKYCRVPARWGFLLRQGEPGTSQYLQKFFSWLTQYLQTHHHTLIIWRANSSFEDVHIIIYKLRRLLKNSNILMGRECLPMGLCTYYVTLKLGIFDPPPLPPM